MICVLVCLSSWTVEKSSVGIVFLPLCDLGTFGLTACDPRAEPILTRALLSRAFHVTPLALSTCQWYHLISLESGRSSLSAMFSQYCFSLLYIDTAGNVLLCDMNVSGP
jgi:hypothetical protein